MHGIHHSKHFDETNSNWSSVFSFWDRLHGTLRLDVPQSAIDIGIAGSLVAMVVLRSRGTKSAATADDNAAQARTSSTLSMNLHPI